MSVSKLLDAVTVTGAGATFNLKGSVNHAKVFAATVDGTGAVAATIVIQVSLDGTNWLTAGTITLSGTTTSSDGFAHEAPWSHYRANCTAISGTSATLTVRMGR